MDRFLQYEVNDMTLKAVEDFYAYAADKSTPNPERKRLGTCRAYVMIYPKYIVLQSYVTIVAVYDRETGTLYDFLRWTYGYTSTSAQHIAKFRNDYCKELWSTGPIVRTWREVK